MSRSSVTDGWSTTWGEYHKSYQHKQLYGGQAYPMLSRLHRPVAHRTHPARQDARHRCAHPRVPRTLRRHDAGRNPAASNLIEGNDARRSRLPRRANVRERQHRRASPTCRVPMAASASNRVVVVALAARRSFARAAAAGTSDESAGGEGGIRTHGTLARTHDFQSCPIGHSGTSPRGRARAEKPALQVIADVRTECSFDRTATTGTAAAHRGRHEKNLDRRAVQVLHVFDGGEGGIRTREAHHLPLFESGTINHSDTSPGGV